MRTPILLGLVAAGIPALASAAPAAVPPSQARSHRGQVGLHLQSGVGFRFIAPYDQQFCGQLNDDGSNRGVCSARSPLTLDIGAAYGLTDRLEFLIEVRVGLESDVGAVPGADGPHQIAFAPGLKVYIDDIGATKFFSTLQFVIDRTDFEQVSNSDYGIRNVNGLQLDLKRRVGLFAYVGDTLAFNRWFRFELDAGIGAQVRFP
jgi:hypothetical protein